MLISTSIFPEIEVQLTATYTGSRMHGSTLGVPPEELPGIEDISISGLYYNKFNLFAGVNLANPEIKTLLHNLLNATSASATDALFDAASDA